ncbi:hypothetical protein FKP32DRAFT_1619686 [Trametes sanguinea]|nr:hypothetical protein FKP32DRAFT_1619686 [Trametes sanguinea]
MRLSVFGDLFPSDAMSSVTHLVLVVLYNNIEAVYGQAEVVDREIVQDSDLQWKHVVAGLVSCIRHLSITHLRLLIRYTISDAVSGPLSPTPYSRDLITGLRDLDQKALAADLLDAVPSLQHIVINTSGSLQVNGIHLGESPEEFTDRCANASYPPVDHGSFHWQTSAAWSTIEPDGTPVSLPRRMRRLSDWVVDGFVRSEDLTISVNDESLLGLGLE